MKFLGLLLILLSAQSINPARILSILPVTVRSHGILYDRLMKELAKRGHEITFVTPFKSDTPTKNIKEIIIPDYEGVIAGGSANINVNKLGYVTTLLPWIFGIILSLVSYRNNDKILELPEIKNLIESAEFDLIFGEPIMDEAVLAGFAYKNKAPVVALSTLMPNYWSNYMVGNPFPSSYMPDPLMPFSSEMNFFERLYNLIFGTCIELTQRINIFLNNRILHRHFGTDAPDIDTVLRNVSLVLVNHHYSLSFPHPQLPNTVDVAGMHIYPPKPLPKDLENYMNTSKNGVILFSLGTNVRSSDLGKEKIDSILDAFASLKENVIWKFEADLENLPKNVKIAKWLPQTDILAHPNLKLFITHGGLLSTTEAAYFGVPLVGVPVMADQPINVKHAENAGIAVGLNLYTLTTDTLCNAIKQVLDNPSYRETAKQRSKVLHDTMSPPLETAVWWIEYVIRHNGTPHLRSASQDLYWFQLHQIDTIAAFILMATVWLYLQVVVAKILFRKFTSKKKIVIKSKPKKSTKSKKNKSI